MTCPLCQSSRSILKRTFKVEQLGGLWEKIFSFNPFEACESKEIRKRQCAQCSLIFFDPPFYGDAKFYEKLSMHSWYYETNKWEFEVASQIIAEHNPASVLEIGCGSGNFLDMIQDVAGHVEGLDINEDAIRKCRSKGITACKGNIESLNNTYDFIALFEVLEHLNGLSDIFEKLLARLNPDGRLIIAVPNPEGYLKEVDINLLDMPPHHNSSWPKETFEYVAGMHGLHIEGYFLEPIRYCHYVGLLGSIVQEVRNTSPKSLKGRMIDILQSVCLRIFAPFFYMQQRSHIVGQTHMVLLRKIEG